MVHGNIVIKMLNALTHVIDSCCTLEVHLLTLINISMRNCKMMRSLCAFEWLQWCVTWNLLNLHLWYTRHGRKDLVTHI